MALMAAHGSAFESLARQRDARTRRHLGYVAQHRSTETEFCRADYVTQPQLPTMNDMQALLKELGTQRY